MPRFELSCCVIFRDEASCLSEWLRFHHSQGVEHFFLYDNRSVDSSREVIANTLPSTAFTVVNWPHSGAQVGAYDHCLQQFGSQCRWLAFIDVDEFLFSPVRADLRSQLQAYASCPAVAVSSLLFGSSGHDARPAGSVTDSFVWRADAQTVFPFRERLRRPDADPTASSSYFSMSAHVKCIVDPARTLRCVNPHRFEYLHDALAVDENETPVPGNYADRVSVERLRINHYWTKSLAEFRAKLQRGRVSGKASYDLVLALKIESMLHQVRDETLVKHPVTPPQAP